MSIREQKKPKKKGKKITNEAIPSEPVRLFVGVKQNYMTVAAGTVGGQARRPETTPANEE